ncbi:hypothetical protein ACIA59_10650 [Micromonospora haikouensis]|uniref:hypothetical protein n=1 Tax=Micromonospora haikouensis TaxID=686309 RepID=UPI003792799D
MAGRTININFGGSAAGAQRAASQAERAVDRVSSKVAAVARSAGRVAVLGAALGSVSAYAIALAATASRAAGAVWLIPGALAAAAVAGAALRAVTFGMADAWKASGQAAAGGGGSAAAAGRQVEAAQRQVRAATRALADAQRDALRAQQDVTRARKDEAERLEDLSRSVRDAQLDEEEATFRLDDARRELADAQGLVARAEQDLAKARASGDAKAITAAEQALADARRDAPDLIRRADLAVRRAQLGLESAQDAAKDLGEEQAEAARKGVEGSDAVRDALDRQRDAQQRVTEAAERLAEAQDAVRDAGQGAASGGIDPATEALNRLSPAGRAVIRTLRALAPAWEAAARSGQQATFRGVAADIRDLSGIYLPRAEQFLIRMGNAFNRAIRQTTGLFQTRDAIRDVDAILGATTSTADRLSRAVRPIINGLLQWAAVGATFLPGFAGEVGTIAERFEKWSTAARESGQMQAWISNGVAVLRQFGAIASNVVGSVRAILRAGDDGGSTVDMLVKGSAALREWLESAEGQQRVSAVLAGLRDIISGIAAAASGADVPAGTFFDTIKVGGTVVSFLADHLDLLAKLLPVLAAGFVISKVAQVGANAAAVAALPIRVAEVAANWGMRSAIQAQTVALNANTATRRVATTAQVAETAATNGGILARGRAIVSMAAQRVAMVATAVATKAWAAAQWLINIAMSANPVGLIIIAIVALIAIIVLIATKTTWFQTAWKYAWAAIQTALKAWWAYAQWVFGLLVTAIGWVKDRIVAGIQGAILIFKLWQLGVGRVKDWIVEKLAALVSWVSGLGARIKRGLGNLASILSSPFRQAFNAIARFWNNTVGRLSFTVPSWVPEFGGNGFSMPQLPMLAQGGVVSARRGGTLAVIGEGGQDEAVAPLGKLATMIEDAVRTTAPAAPVVENHIHAEVRVFVGDREITDIVRVEISDRDRQVRRRVTAGAGRAR